MRLLIALTLATIFSQIASAESSACPPSPRPSSTQASAVPYLLDALCRNAWNSATGARYIIVHDTDRDVEFGVFEFSLNDYALRILPAPPEGARADHWAENPETVFVINGGYFDFNKQEKLVSDGLLVSEGELLHPLTKALSGILAADDKSVRIAFTHEWPLKAQAKYALQSKPMLVHPGHEFGMRGDDGRRARRSAICLPAPQHIDLIYVGGLGLTLFELAKLLIAPRDAGGLACDAALNLDGGPSTQLIYKLDGVKFRRTGQAVANAITIEKRPQLGRDEKPHS